MATGWGQIERLRWQRKMDDCYAGRGLRISWRISPSHRDGKKVEEYVANGRDHRVLY
jgi:hypothetical protein